MLQILSKWQLRPFNSLFSPCLPLCPIIVSHCLPTCVPVLDGVSAFPRSCLPLSPLVSPCLPFSLTVSPHACLCLDGVSLCLPLSPSHVCLCWVHEALSPLASHCLPWSPRMCACVGWCVRLLEVLSGIVFLLVSLCRIVCAPSRGLLSPCLPLCPILSAHGRLCWKVCSPSPGEVFPPLSPHMCASVGWCVRLPEVFSPLVPTYVCLC